MLRFCDSFSHYSTNDLYGLGNGAKWTSLSSGSGLQYFFIVPGGGRFGSSALRWNASSSSTCAIKTLDNQPTWIVGFAFRYSNIPNGYVSMMGLLDSGTEQLQLGLNVDGTLSMFRSASPLNNSLNATTKSTNALSMNTWYYIEFMGTISSSIVAHTCKVNVNGTNTGWIDLTAGQNTRNTANNSANSIYIARYSNQSNNTTLSVDYGDLYICDGTGSTNNTFLGDVRVEARYPLAAGTNAAWLGSGGTPVACVSEQALNGDVSFISSANTNDISTFTVPTLSVNPTTIFGMQVTHTSRKSDAGTRQIADVIRSGTTNYVGTTQNLGVQYQMYSTVWETDPNTSAAWTYAGANALEFGAKEIS